MKISIDFDGTITRYPDFFRAIMASMQRAGHSVGVLTGRHHENEQEVRDWLTFHGFPLPDFCICRAATTDPNSSGHKAESIVLHHIDYHIDDCDLGHPDSIAKLTGIEKVICIR